MAVQKLSVDVGEQSSTTSNFSSNHISISRFGGSVRKYIPKFSQIDKVTYSFIFKQSLALTGGIVLGIADSDKDFLVKHLDKTISATTSKQTFTTGDVASSFYSKNAQSGEVSVANASHFRFELGHTLRKWTIYGWEWNLTYTPPAYSISTYTVVDGVTNGVGGTATGGGTWDVTVDDQTVTLTATPAEGYRFIYWADGTGSVGTDTTLTLTISQNDISAFETSKSYGAFFEKITYTITATAGEGGTVTGGGMYGYGETATLKASPNTGYKFVQWSDGVTTATRTVTVTGAGTYKAVFSPICVTYDSIFNFYRWKEKGVTSSRGTVSNVTDAGFTFTASIDDAYTDYSHMFKVESGKTYTFEYDFSGGNSHESFVFFHNAEGDYSWTKLASSTAAKWNFTVPDGYSLASVRFDVNTNGETITYSNIRIYPANCSFMSDTLSVSDRTDKAKWSVPTSTRDCYKFIGWNTKEDGSGTYYTASSTYPSEDLVLYSIWQADPPKISDVQVIYGGKVVSSTNKVPAGQSYIVKCKLE